MITITKTEFLRRVRDLLEDPEHWHQGSFGRDSEGERLSSAVDEQAVAFCLKGACHRALRDVQREKLGEAVLIEFDSAYECLREHALHHLEDKDVPWYDDPIVRFNDREDTSHGDVLGLIDECL